VVAIVYHMEKFLCSCNAFGSYRIFALYLWHRGLPLDNRIPSRMPSLLVFSFQCERNTFQSWSAATSLALLLWRCT
jgi:hypothetical protein